MLIQNVLIISFTFRTKLSAEKFQILMHLKALRSLAEPGEGVGLLAAQVSLGNRDEICLYIIIMLNVQTKNDE